MTFFFGSFGTTGILFVVTAAMAVAVVSMHNDAQMRVDSGATAKQPRASTGANLIRWDEMTKSLTSNPVMIISSVAQSNHNDNRKAY